MQVNDTLQRAVESLADSAEVEWTELETLAPDEETKRTVQILAEIASIARVHADGSRRAARPAPFEWGALHVRECIARGAHGDVYRAWDPRLEREVALKLLRGDRGSDASAAIAEGRLLARVSHPNVVAVYGADRIHGEAGVWMEYVDGQTLYRQIVSGGALQSAAAIAVGVAVCDGLAAIHAAGLIHRDVKAQNVIRDRSDRTVLMDLGAGHDGATGNDGLEGTPLYFAPELLAGGSATVASDIYATGVLLFFALTGRYPVTATSLDEFRRRHQVEAASSVDEIPGVPAALRAVLRRSLAKNPSDRFSSVEEMKGALSAACPRYRRRIRAGVVAMAATVVALAVGWIYRAPATRSAEPQWVMVAPFDNRTAEAALDGVAEMLLNRELSDSPSLRVASGARIADALQLMRRSETPVDAGLAREVCLRDGGISSFVTGRVSRGPAGYQVHASLVDVASAAVLASFDEAGGTAGELATAVARIGGRIRARFGDRAGSASVAPLERVTVRSLRGLRLYTESYELGGRYRWKAALPLVREALEIEPEFPSARVWLAWCLRNTGHPENEYRPEALRAAEEAATVSEWERLWIKGSERSLADDETGAAQFYQQLLRLRPDHYWAASNLAFHYESLGWPADAVAFLTRYASSRPNDPLANVQAVRALIRNGQLDRAATYAERVRAINRAREDRWMPIAWMFPANERWLRNDPRGARRALDEIFHAVAAIPEHGRVRIAGELGMAYASLGLAGQAYAAADLTPGATERAINRGFIALALGDQNTAERESLTVLPHPIDRRIIASLVKTDLWLDALALATRAGRALDAAAALRLIPVSARNYETSFMERGLRAEIDRQLGRLDASAAQAEQLLADPKIQPFGAIRASVTLARGHLSVHSPLLAIDVLKDALARRQLDVWGIQSGATWQDAELLLAETYQQVGRQADAERLVLQVREMMPEADPNTGIAARLRRLLSR